VIVVELGKFLVSLVLFVFSIFLFPTLNETASGYVGELSVVVHVFPMMFIVVSAVFPIFFLMAKEK
jgi:hypothetical protein